MAGVDLTTVDGLDVLTVQAVLSETGVDMQPWRTSKHFASWLSVCPENAKTGGKIIKRGTKPSANRAALALRLAARSLIIATVRSAPSTAGCAASWASRGGDGHGAQARPHHLRHVKEQAALPRPWRRPRSAGARTQAQAVEASGQRTGLRTDAQRRLSTARLDLVLPNPGAQRRGVAASAAVRPARLNSARCVRMTPQNTTFAVKLAWAAPTGLLPTAPLNVFLGRHAVVHTQIVLSTPRSTQMDSAPSGSRTVRTGRRGKACLLR